MSTKPTAPESKNKKNAVKAGLSTFTKILLSLFLILAIFVVWFVFHAWQVLNNAPDTAGYASQASFEILTPNGAPGNNNTAQSPVFIPNATVTTASDSDNNESASAPQTPATPIKNSTKPKANADNEELQPLVPTNTPAATNRDNNPETPAAPAPAPKPKSSNNSANGKPLDNLF